MVTATLIVSNKGSEANKRIITFIDKQLPDLVKIGVEFDFQIAFPADKKHYDEQGITDFPFLQIGDTRVSKSNEIIRHLTNTIKKQHIKQEERTPNDDIHDYMMESLGTPQVDARGNVQESDDEDPDGVGNFQSKISEELERRKIPKPEKQETPAPVAPPRTARPAAPAPRQDNIAAPKIRPMVKPARRPARRNQARPTVAVDPKTSDVLATMGSTGEERRDDNLMARLFDNQETTSM